MAKSNVIFGGSGGKNSSLVMWAELSEGTKSLVISKFKPGHSVYALAISPNGNKVAAGTKKGLLQVHSLSNFQASENSMPLLEVYHLPAVTSLAFCTEDILASGNLKGQIKLWSIPEKRLLVEFSAHSNGVFALRQMGTLVLASIGGDNVLRVWDLDTLKVEYESPPFTLPRISTFVSLDYDFANGLLMHPSRDGDIHLYDTRKGFTKHLIHAHSGDFSALACGNKYVVTAGLEEDKTIKLWPSSMDTDVPIKEKKAPSGVWAASWGGTNSIITAYTDGSSQIWKFDGDLLPGHRFHNLDLRSTIGLPAKLVANYQIEAERQWRDSKLAEARELMNKPERQRELIVIVNELKEHGFSAEAVLILADAAKAQNQLLWELESRIVLLEGLGNDKTALSSLYALGELLQKLKEPKLAQDYFEKILQIDENYLDVNERIIDLKSDPLIHLCPGKDVRGDLMQKGWLSQELEKYRILNKKFSWEVIIKIGWKLSTVCLSAKQVAESVSKAIKKYNLDAFPAGLKQGSLFSGKELRDITWAYVLSTRKKLPIAFAMEIHSTTRGSELISYEVFETELLEISPEISVDEHNQQVENAWKKLRGSFSKDAESWLTGVSDISKEGIDQLVRKELARQDDEY